MSSIRSRVADGARLLAGALDTAAREAGAPSRATPEFGEAMTASPAGSYGARETHPWVLADIDKIQYALLSALDGQPAALQDIYDDILDRDDRVSACFRTRTLAVIGRPYTVKPAQGLEQNERAKYIASECADILTSYHRLPIVIGEMAAAILRGFSVHEIDWAVDRQGRYVPRDLIWRAPNRFCWGPDLRIARKDARDPRHGVPLEELKPDGWLVHSPSAGRASYVMRAGAMLPIIVPALAKKQGMRSWLKGAERMGVPLPVITVPTGNDQLRTAALDILRGMQAHWGAVLWGGITIDKVQGTGDFTADVFDKLIANANTGIAIAMLGQNLTTEVSGGSFAAATAHNFVRGDLLTADLVEIGVTMRHLLALIVRFNWPGEPVPIFEMRIGTKQVPTIEEVRDGVFSEDDLRELKGFAPKVDGTGSDFRRPIAVAPAPAATVPTQTPSVALPTPADAPTVDVQQTALNVAQVSSLQEVLINVAIGKLPRETGIALITSAFPISQEKAEAIMSTLGNGFVPTPDGEAPPTASPGGAPAAPPFRSSPVTVVPMISRLPR